MELSTSSASAHRSSVRRAVRSRAVGTKTQATALEPRFFLRAEAGIEATIEIGDLAVDGRVMNLSEGGALVAVPGSCPVGARVEVKVGIGGRAMAYRLSATVVRVETNDDGALVGLAWASLDDGAASAIRSFVSTKEPIFWSDEPATLPRAVAAEFIPLIRRIARGVARNLPAHVSVDDLVGAGFVALVELYAKKRGASPDDFEQMARVRVRGAMLDHLRQADPLARRARKGVRRISEARAKLEASLGRAATHDEVQKALGVSSDAYQQLLARADAAMQTSLDDGFASDIADARAESGMDAVHAAETRRTLVQAFKALPERLQRVLDLHYNEDLTLRAIGNILGVSEARVSQLVSQAVGHLRSSYADATREVA
jgi:RNA polymerase sigma factor for flagellar operon FliA